MNLNNFRNRFLEKRIKAFEKYNYLKSKFINREKEAKKDLEESLKIINELKEKLKWDGSLP